MDAPGVVGLDRTVDVNLAGVGGTWGDNVELRNTGMTTANRRHLSPRAGAMKRKISTICPE